MLHWANSSEAVTVQCCGDLCWHALLPVHLWQDCHQLLPMPPLLPGLVQSELQACAAAVTTDICIIKIFRSILELCCHLHVLQGMLALHTSRPWF